MSIPRATYRIQLHRGFGFRDAADLVPYLAALGVSHVYCSPYLRARSGSTHGYDIIGHHELNPEIGTRAEYDSFVAALHEHGMGQLMDVVPNHMGVMAADNAWWMDVLENGQASSYADYFDIDWHPASAHLENRLLVPVLGKHYGATLEAGELALSFDAVQGTFSVHYFQHRFPIDPRTYPHVLRRVAGELDSVAEAFSRLPSREERNRFEERNAGKEALKDHLAQRCAVNPGLVREIEAAVQQINGRAGEAASFDALHELLDGQAYRLAFWRVASDEINYRRFFDINDLAALRMEKPEVFEATHAFIFELIREGAVDALRIDHPDGLYDPAAYFRRLQEKYLAVCGEGKAIEPRRPMYVVLEKIIASFEDMPHSWPVHGSTGYRFANLVNGVFVDESSARAFTRLYAGYTGVGESFEEIAKRSRHLILRTSLASELTVLANRLARIAHSRRATRDYTLNTLRQALAEVIASFPVYRTYVAEHRSSEDKRWIEWAIARARRRTRAADMSIFDFVGSALLSDEPEMRAFTMKFQQVTAPVMAKGVEDTSFYIYNRLVSLNDVGGDPATFGHGVNAFHGASAVRTAHWPHTMLATSTHDNKRAEDVRARINVLSEVPAAWRLNLRRWTRMNRSKKTTLEGTQAPSRNDEYLLYQTLLGSFDFPQTAGELGEYAKRIESYMLKAVREAKAHSSWINADADYESAVSTFVHGLLKPGRNIFLERLQEAAKTVGWLGMLNSLSMTVIKLTSPGVPDIYQGSELWDFSLVDPDNRRPVDYEKRRRLLASLPVAGRTSYARIRELFLAPHDGRAKLYLIRQLLGHRARNPDFFRNAGYTPLLAEGQRQPNVLCFARKHLDAGLLTVAPRLHASLGLGEGALPIGKAVWGDTKIAVPFLADGTSLYDIVSGRRVTIEGNCLAVADVLVDAPVAALVPD
jgi:(1->4)-alpha-D-glucan 1-alpha-D-glucosylmutase